MNHALEVKAFNKEALLKAIEESAQRARERLEEYVAEARERVALTASMGDASFLDAFTTAVAVRVVDFQGVPAGRFALEGDVRLLRREGDYYQQSKSLYDNDAGAHLKKAGTVRVIVLVLPLEDASK